MPKTSRRARLSPPSSPKRRRGCARASRTVGSAAVGRNGGEGSAGLPQGGQGQVGQDRGEGAAWRAQAARHRPHEEARARGARQVRHRPSRAPTASKSRRDGKLDLAEFTSLVFECTFEPAEPVAVAPVGAGAHIAAVAADSGRSSRRPTRTSRGRSRAELRTVLKMLGIDAGKKGVAKLLAKYDADQNKKLDLDEFKALVADLQAEAAEAAAAPALPSWRTAKARAGGRAPRERGGGRGGGGRGEPRARARPRAREGDGDLRGARPLPHPQPVPQLRAARGRAAARVLVDRRAASAAAPPRLRRRHAAGVHPFNAGAAGVGAAGYSRRTARGSARGARRSSTHSACTRTGSRRAMPRRWRRRWRRGTTDASRTRRRGSAALRRCATRGSLRCDAAPGARVGRSQERRRRVAPPRRRDRGGRAAGRPL